MSTSDVTPRPATERLLRQVARRQYVASVGDRFHLFALAIAALYAAGFLVSRLLGLIPNWFQPVTLLALPAGAFVLGLLLHRRPSATDAARLVDTRSATNDLFLTTTFLTQAPGGFKFIVAAQAEERAANIVPSKVVPFDWQAKASHVAAALAALLLAVEFVPQLDPFGRHRQRQEEAQRLRTLADSRKATELRLAQLQKANPEARTSEEARQAIEELKATFNAMKPEEKKANLQRLVEVQKELGEIWRKRSEERLKDAFDRDPQGQRLGAGQGEKAERWKRRLQRGDPFELKKEVQEIQDKARSVSQLGDSAEKRKLQGELRQQLKDLSEFLSQNASSKSLEAAVNRALEQLAMAEQKGLSKDAMKGLQESLQLTGAEMDALAQAIRDLQGLEKGLNAAQLAKLANQLKGLDGNATQGLKELDDYEEFYKKLLAQAGQCPVHGPG